MNHVDEREDTAAIRELFERACRAWSDGDAEAYGSCFTDDCDYVSYDGFWEHGRDPVTASHDKLFRGVLTGSRLVGHVDAIRPLGTDVALVHATGAVLVAWRAKLPSRRRTRNTIVAVRGASGWRFTAMQNGRIRPVGVPDPQSLPSRVARAFDRASRAAKIGRYHQGA